MLQWPAYSPVLNNIENLWAIVKRRLQKKERITWEKLEETVIRIWEIIDEKTLKKPYNSMKIRVNSFSKAKGGTIGY